MVGVCVCVYGALSLSHTLSPVRRFVPSVRHASKLERVATYVRSLVNRIVNWLRGPSDAANSVEGAGGKERSPKGDAEGRGRSGGSAGSRETSPPAKGVCETLDRGAIRRIVILPEGMDRNEWIASHILGIFEHINALRGSVSEMCTAESCPSMSYPGVPKLSWVDEKGKKHAYSACQYMDCALSQVEQRIDDPILFPTKHGQPFPSSFPTTVSSIMRLLWQCLGHVYDRHWKHIEALNLAPQASLVLEHLCLFSAEFALLDKEEQKRLDTVVDVVRPHRMEVE